MALLLFGLESRVPIPERLPCYTSSRDASKRVQTVRCVMKADVFNGTDNRQHT